MVGGGCRGILPETSYVVSFGMIEVREEIGGWERMQARAVLPTDTPAEFRRRATIDPLTISNHAPFRYWL